MSEESTAATTPASVDNQHLKPSRLFSKQGVDPYSTVSFETRDAVIRGGGGKTVFEQKGVEFPTSWSQLATNVVASKYFRGHIGSPGREYSVRQLIGRVVDTITKWGEEEGYFGSDNEFLGTKADKDSASVFRDELTHILLEQRACFNSPVWFNVGVKEKPQCSACFILSVEDSMESILNWYSEEGVIFKGGSGAGINLSNLRSSKEKLSVGGIASGPVSFMKAADASAGVIKSGGATRRAAKMVILNADHPDIEDFVRCKGDEEKKAWALIEAGYDDSIDGEAYGSVFFQNANNSVRVTDDFMRAVKDDLEWSTVNVKDGSLNPPIRARDLWNLISDQAWFCGDPGLQFDTTINDWHTCPNAGRINASNPCVEYMHLDNSACNLASINLMKFVTSDGVFDEASFRHVVDIMITAQDIIVSRSSYPTDKIGDNARNYRQLGLGYANLGAMLMSMGIPYDSDAGRNLAATVTSIMCGEAYRQSSEIARVLDPYGGYEANSEAQIRVIEKHREASRKIPTDISQPHLHAAAQRAWDAALKSSRTNGVRNSQVTVLAPTGTIAFMMDCDTTGVEPDIALVKYKNLVGGGSIKYVNSTVSCALGSLGYTSDQVSEIVAYLESTGTIEGAPYIKDEDLPVFDCAFVPQNGSRSIEPMGHIKMMGAVQPFISGAISKTVNLPNSATASDIGDAYMRAWELGLKAVAVYRDGSKKSQPLNTGKTKAKVENGVMPARRRLSADCEAARHKFEIAGHEGYIHVGFFEDGTPGEVFIKMAKEGSTISGLMDTIATLTSIAMQYGVPVDALVNKFSHVRFEPSGFTKNPDIPVAKSLTDYIFRFLGMKFGGARPVDNIPGVQVEVTGGSAIIAQVDAPTCTDCGSIMVRNGSCYKCNNCGASSGCS